MAELAQSCCSSDTQATCCDPSEQELCCGSEHAAGTCGCLKAPEIDIRRASTDSISGFNNPCR